MYECKADYFLRLDSYANKMVNDFFDGTKGFAIDGGIKDSTHIRKLAAETNSPMPALVRLLGRYILTSL